MGRTDHCGDSSFNTYEQFLVNQNDTGEIISIIIQNNKFNQASFSLDGHVVNVDAGCGFEIYRKDDHFVLSCICFQL